MMINMNIFISHHIGKDEKLALILQYSLKKRGIKGFIAERKQEYELLIIDKIKNEIKNSSYFVAIITKHGLTSASVHEEIGYAIGFDIPVILMVEESVDEQGVLIHGKESYYFERRFFETESDEISKYILSKGIPKKKRSNQLKRTKEKDQYQQFNPTQKITRLTKDSIKAFQEHKFKHKILNLKNNERYYSLPNKIKINVFENNKRKERFFLFTCDELKTDASVREIKENIRDFIFKNISLKGNWKSMCLISVYGNVTKLRIQNFYDGINYPQSKTKQNTTVVLDPAIIYHGLGQGGLAHSKGDLNYPSSLPKFFIHKLKSKDDIVGRIGIIEDFIDEHEKIFQNVSNLKTYEKKYQIIPREKVKEKQEIQRKKEEKRRKKRWKMVKRRAPARRRPIRGGYGGNPAYIGTPKE